MSNKLFTSSIAELSECITLVVCVLLLLVPQTAARAINMSHELKEFCEPEVNLVDAAHSVRVKEQILDPLLQQAQSRSNEVDGAMRSFVSAHSQ